MPKKKLPRPSFVTTLAASGVALAMLGCGGQTSDSTGETGPSGAGAAGASGGTPGAGGVGPGPGFGGMGANPPCPAWACAGAPGQGAGGSVAGAGGATAGAGGSAAGGATVAGAGGAIAGAGGSGLGGQTNPPPPCPAPNAIAPGVSCAYLSQKCGGVDPCNPSFSGVIDFVCSAVDGQIVWATPEPLPCQAPPCPPTAPAAGDACEKIGQSCSYGVCADWVCTDQAGWVSVGGPCNPPPPDPCPPLSPVIGASCNGFTQCTYSTSAAGACGPFFFKAVCPGPGASWQVEAPIDPCDAQTHCAKGIDAVACGQLTGCSWLTPGCADETPPLALSAPGCHWTATDCGGNVACPAGTTCQAVVIDPCAGSVCNACGAEKNLCLP